MAASIPSLNVLMFHTKSYDKSSFEEALAAKTGCCKLNFTYTTKGVDPDSLQEYVSKSHFDVVCVFVNDYCNAEMIDAFAKANIKVIALRCAGFNNVDIARATKHGIKVLNVPAYSPNAIAEHSVALLMCLNRKIHIAHNRVQLHDFTLDGLQGFDMYGKTVGVLGTGRIGKCSISIFRGFGCRVLAFDIYQDKQAAEQLGFEYTTLWMWFWSPIITIFITRL